MMLELALLLLWALMLASVRAIGLEGVHHVCRPALALEDEGGAVLAVTPVPVRETGAEGSHQH